MSISKKIKTLNNETKQNKVQYNLDKLSAKIFTFSSGNVS